VASKLPAETDRLEAIRRLLVGLKRGDDVFGLIDSVAELHPKHDTFPGEVYMGLGADALDIAGATRDEPISYEGLRESFLPECEFRGKQNRKIQYAILTSASLRGGLEPELLDEVVWWGESEYWRYALYAAVALLRACADRSDTTVAEFVERLASRHRLRLA
jgi:hypothetical protein